MYIKRMNNRTSLRRKLNQTKLVASITFGVVEAITINLGRNKKILLTREQEKKVMIMKLLMIKMSLNAKVHFREDTVHTVN